MNYRSGYIFNILLECFQLTGKSLKLLKRTKDIVIYYSHETSGTILNMHFFLFTFQCDLFQLLSFQSFRALNLLLHIFFYLHISNILCFISYFLIQLYMSKPSKNGHSDEAQTSMNERILVSIEYQRLTRKFENSDRIFNEILKEL